MPSFHPGTAYVFLQLKVAGVVDYENDYRPKRQALLEIACGAAKNRFPDLTKVIGIAIDAPKFSKGRNSEDFVLMRCDEWPDERRLHYERANEGFNFFQISSPFEKRVTEFPDPIRRAPVPLRKSSRNGPCPCGSGHKYKRCCGR
jgi:hypothetical protein